MAVVLRAAIALRCARPCPIDRHCGTRRRFTVTKKRPVGVTILGILALLAALAAGIHTLQMLHLWPISFTGPVTDVSFRFFTFDLLGALLWGLMFAIYLWVFRMLWNVDPQGWLFLVVLSIFNLILAVLTIIGQTAWQDMSWALVINAIILIYCLLPGTKKAFEVQ
jgi:hypothetical protein